MENNNIGQAIFILDETPRSCKAGYMDRHYDCPLFTDNYYCTGARRSVEPDCQCDVARPAWCPLGEIPEYESNNYITDDDIECLPDDYEVSTAYAFGHQQGWNDCLNQIKHRGLK